LAEFKEAIKKEGSEGILKIGHGETVTGFLILILLEF
jgi:hypothetical protein